MFTAEHEVVLRLLAELRRAGWAFVVRHLPAEPDRLDSIFGAYSHGAVFDTLRFWSDRDAIGARVRAHDPASLDNPRVEVLWGRSGTLIEVIDELTSLPHPDSRLAPKFGRPSTNLWLPPSVL